MRLELLCGPIGSGKSTYALKRAREGAIIVSHDSISAGCHGEYRYEQELRAFYREVEEATALAAIRAGRDAVCDRTHLTRESRGRWVRFADRVRDGWLADWPAENRPDLTVIAVVFPREPASAHAARRFAADARGRSAEDWLAVARHHEQQAVLEPVDPLTEGFDEVVYEGPLL